MELMHGLVAHWYGPSRIVSSSCGVQGQLKLPLKQELQPPSDGSRQSLCPAKFAAFTSLSQSHTVVIAPSPPQLTLHVPLAHVLHACVPPSERAAQVAAAAAFGWHSAPPTVHPPAHE